MSTEAAQSAANLKDATTAAAAPAAEAPAAAAPAAAAAAPADGGTLAADDDAESECPICKFMQAGPCGEGHKDWQACRKEAKSEGVEFVQHCSQTFRTFFGCMLQHQEYYQPFLEAFHVDVDKSQEAIDKDREPEQQQQQRQQQPQQQQQQQQQPQQHQPPAGAKHSPNGSGR